ncbi:hypothetical protein, partial [Legionella quateirensis]
KISSPIPSALEIKLSCLQFKDTSLGVGPKGRIPGFHSTFIHFFDLHHIPNVPALVHSEHNDGNWNTAIL